MALWYFLGLVILVSLLLGIRNLYLRILKLQYENRNYEREREVVLDFFNQIGHQFTTGVDPERTMRLMVDFAQEACKADAAAIFVRDEGTNILRAHAVQGLFPPLHNPSSDKLLAKRKYLVQKIKKDSIRVGEGLIGKVAETGKGMLVKNAEEDKRIPPEAGAVVELRDLILQPLISRGEILGVVALVNKREEPPFNESDQSLVNALAEQAALALDLVKLYRIMADKQRMEQELNIAKQFQRLLLPREIPAIPGLEVAGYSAPALEVGGDYYDFIKVDEHHLGVAIADVSGKGIPGALVMATVRATLQAEARLSYSPKEVLRRVNDRVAADTKENVFITMTYGILDTRTGIFRFVRAGHEPVVCISRQDGELSKFSPNGIALGIVAGDMFDVVEEVEIDLSQEGTAVLYTDGVVEAMNARTEEYGEARLHEVLQQHGEDPAKQIIDEMLADIERFTGGLSQHDDITIVVVNWTGKEGSMEPDAVENKKASTAVKRRATR